MTINFRSRQKAIEEWLNALMRKQIAQINHISTGAVSLLVREFKEQSGGLYFEIEIAKFLHKKALNFLQLEKAIGFQQVLESRGYTIESVERALDHLDEHCFRIGHKLDDFLVNITSVVDKIDDLSIPIEKFDITIFQKSQTINHQNYRLEENNQILYKQPSLLRELEKFRQLQPIYASYVQELDLRRDKVKIIDSLKEKVISLETQMA